MIASIEGTLARVADNTAFLRIPGGIVIEVHLPAHLAADLTAEFANTPARTPITLCTRLTLDTTNQGASFSPRLLGFATARDRDFFELLTTVRGLGARKALRAMTLPPAEIAAAIASADAKTLQTLPEIGKKMATTIINELQEQAAAFAPEFSQTAGTPTTAQPAKPAHATPAIEDAITALVSLGQTLPDAEKAIARALDGIDAATATADELIQRAFTAPKP